MSSLVRPHPQTKSAFIFDNLQWQKKYLIVLILAKFKPPSYVGIMKWHSARISHIHCSIVEGGLYMQKPAAWGYFYL